MSLEIENKVIALLIDSDNISRDYYAVLLDELSKYGRVTYRKLYGDFSKPKANGWQQALLEHSIEQVQQIAYTSGKNATDSTMIIDAMDILYKGKVDCFCLATNDSDFTSLAMRFRNDNLVIIGAGVERTPNSFRRACDRFIPIDELLKAKNEASIDETPKATPNEQPKLKTDTPPGTKKADTIITKKRKNLVDMATAIIKNGAEIDGKMHFSTFMNELYRKENDFNPKLYGHTNSSAGSFFKSLTKNFVLEKKGNVDYIGLNK